MKIGGKFSTRMWITGTPRITPTVFISIFCASWNYVERLPRSLRYCERRNKNEEFANVANHKYASINFLFVCVWLWTEKHRQLMTATGNANVIALAFLLVVINCFSRVLSICLRTLQTDTSFPQTVNVHKWERYSEVIAMTYNTHEYRCEKVPNWKTESREMPLGCLQRIRPNADAGAFELRSRERTPGCVPACQHGVVTALRRPPASRHANSPCLLFNYSFTPQRLSGMWAEVR